MIDLELARPFLETAADDPSAATRLAAVEALTYLPLEPRVWHDVAAVGSGLLRDLERASALDPHALSVLTRIPVRSIRERIGRIAADPSHPAFFEGALALARHHDAAGLEHLSAEFAKVPTAHVAQHLAALPLEELGASPEPFERALAGEDGMVRLWAAIALARLGNLEPFEQLWDVLVSEQEFDRAGRQRIFTEAPPLFWGDPWTVYRTLANVRPLPQRLLKFVTDLYAHETTALHDREGHSARLPRNAALLVGGLTGLLDEYGEPVSDLPARPREENDAPPKGTIAVLTVDELVALSRSYPNPEEGGYTVINNALLDRARELPARVDLPLENMLRNRAVLTSLPRPALCWTLSRAGAERLTADSGPMLKSATPGDRAELLSWVRDIASQLNADPPYTGAGPSTGVTAGPEIVIDDRVHRAARMRPADPPVSRGWGEEADPEQPVQAATTVFPDLQVSDDHPVARAPIVIEVALSRDAIEGVVGAVILPPAAPDAVHTLDVHLLLGDARLNDSLKYSVGGGTLKRARFKVKAPAVTSQDRDIVPIRVNFYLNQRWCGEGLRNVDVRRDPSVAPLNPVPPPDVPDWRTLISMEPDAQPSDLIVRIQRIRSGEYVWTCLSPHIPLAGPADPRDSMASLGSDAETFVRNLFKPFASKRLGDIDIADVEGAGETIYQNTPRVFKDAYWAVWDAAKGGTFTFESIQIVTDEPFVPWELMRIGDDERGPEVEPEFLAIRHSVGRWIATESARLSQTIPITSIAVAASDYATVAAVSQKLPWAAAESKFLVGTFGATAVSLTSAAMLDFLKNGRVQAIHFACHGQMSVTAPDTSQLILEDTPNNLRPTAVNRTEVRRGLGREHPLVFLNACEVGGVAASLSLVAGFPAAFLNAGAAAVISPLWVVNDERAKEISEFFYNAALARPPRTLGDVMREIRARWREGRHLTYLAYVLYGDPLARIEYL